MDFGNPDTWSTAIYFWIIPAVLGDAIFPPIPSEMVLITGGALSAEGRANLFLVGVLSATASWLGDVVVFQLFKRRLSHILDRWRWGRKVHHGIHDAIAKAGRSSTYGTIIGARFIPGGRLATSAAAGIADVSTQGFSLCAGLGALLWATWLVGLAATAPPSMSRTALQSPAPRRLHWRPAATAAAEHRKRACQRNAFDGVAHHGCRFPGCAVLTVVFGGLHKEPQVQLRHAAGQFQLV